MVPQDSTARELLHGVGVVYQCHWTAQRVSYCKEWGLCTGVAEQHNV